MQALFRFFFELCLLKRAPQDLPASEVLMWTVLVADLIVGLIAAATAGLPLGIGLAHTLSDQILTLGALYIALVLTKHPARYNQAATAMLGAGALLGIAAIPPLAMDATGSEETDAATLGAVLLVGLLVWNILVTGHILKHTFGITLGQGTAIAFAFEVFAISAIGTLFGTG